MSNYGKVESEWQPCKQYRKPNYDFIDKLHPLIHKEIIEERIKQEERNQFSNFKVTKLERGDEESYKNFEPLRFQKLKKAGVKKTTPEQDRENFKKEFMRKELRLEQLVEEDSDTTRDFG